MYTRHDSISSPAAHLQAAFLSQDQNLDPRLEDIKAVQKIYEQLLKPHLTRNPSWVSPSSLWVFPMKDPYDLKVSNGVRAKVCERDFDLEQTKLVFTLPMKECKFCQFQ